MIEAVNTYKLAELMGLKKIKNYKFKNEYYKKNN